MASEKQIEANRRNAALSTGPRTAGGKAKSSLNAFKHGMRANLIYPWPGEDPRELQEFAEALYSKFCDAGFLEDNLVFGMIQDRIRMRRADKLEAAILWSGADEEGSGTEADGKASGQTETAQPQGIQAEQRETETAEACKQDEEGISTLEDLIAESPFSGVGGKELRAMIGRFGRNVPALELIRRYRLSAENNFWRKLGVFGQLYQARGRAAVNNLMSIVYEKVYAHDDPTSRTDLRGRSDPSADGGV